MRVDVWFASRQILADSLCFRECGQIFNKDDALAAFEDGKYDYMGAIEATSIVEAYLMTQRRSEYWRPRAKRRSAKRGDIFTIDNEMHCVAKEQFVRLR